MSAGEQTLYASAADGSVRNTSLVPSSESGPDPVAVRAVIAAAGGDESMASLASGSAADEQGAGTTTTTTTITSITTTTNTEEVDETSQAVEAGASVPENSDPDGLDGIPAGATQAVSTEAGLSDSLGAEEPLEPLGGGLEGDLVSSQFSRVNNISNLFPGAASEMLPSDFIASAPTDLTSTSAPAQDESGGDRDVSMTDVPNVTVGANVSMADGDDGSEERADGGEVGEGEEDSQDARAGEVFHHGRVMANSGTSKGRPRAGFEYSQEDHEWFFDHGCEIPDLQAPLVPLRCPRVGVPKSEALLWPEPNPNPETREDLARERGLEGEPVWPLASPDQLESYLRAVAMVLSVSLPLTDSVGASATRELIEAGSIVGALGVIQRNPARLSRPGTDARLSALGLTPMVASALIADVSRYRQTNFRQWSRSLAVVEKEAIEGTTHYPPGDSRRLTHAWFLLQSSSHWAQWDLSEMLVEEESRGDLPHFMQLPSYRQLYGFMNFDDDSDVEGASNGDNAAAGGEPQSDAVPVDESENDASADALAPDVGEEGSKAQTGDEDPNAAADEDNGADAAAADLPGASSSSSSASAAQGNPDGTSGSSHTNNSSESDPGHGRDSDSDSDFAGMSDREGSQHLGVRRGGIRKRPHRRPTALSDLVKKMMPLEQFPMVTETYVDDQALTFVSALHSTVPPADKQPKWADEMKRNMLDMEKGNKKRDSMLREIYKAVRNMTSSINVDGPVVGSSDGQHEGQPRRPKTEPSIHSDSVHSDANQDTPAVFNPPPTDDAKGKKAVSQVILPPAAVPPAKPTKADKLKAQEAQRLKRSKMRAEKDAEKAKKAAERHQLVLDKAQKAAELAAEKRRIADEAAKKAAELARKEQELIETRDLNAQEAYEHTIDAFIAGDDPSEMAPPPADATKNPELTKSPNRPKSNSADNLKQSRITATTKPKVSKPVQRPKSNEKDGDEARERSSMIQAQLEQQVKDRKSTKISSLAPPAPGSQSSKWRAPPKNLPKALRDLWTWDADANVGLDEVASPERGRRSSSGSRSGVYSRSAVPQANSDDENENENENENEKVGTPVRRESVPRVRAAKNKAKTIAEVQNTIDHLSESEDESSSSPTAPSTSTSTKTTAKAAKATEKTEKATVKTEKRAARAGGKSGDIQTMLANQPKKSTKVSTPKAGSSRSSKAGKSSSSSSRKTTVVDSDSDGLGSGAQSISSDSDSSSGSGDSDSSSGGSSGSGNSYSSDSDSSTDHESSRSKSSSSRKRKREKSGSRAHDRPPSKRDRRDTPLSRKVAPFSSRLPVDSDTDGTHDRYSSVPMDRSRKAREVGRQGGVNLDVVHQMVSFVYKTASSFSAQKLQEYASSAVKVRNLIRTKFSSSQDETDVAVDQALEKLNNLLMRKVSQQSVKESKSRGSRSRGSGRDSGRERDSRKHRRSRSHASSRSSSSHYKKKHRR